MSYQAPEIIYSSLIIIFNVLNQTMSVASATEYSIIGISTFFLACLLDFHSFSF
ncbi:hypothetical protein BCR42DRAFT_424658 [Absidia repens]|uniref:Uncharacterized protein n=1 Tax=Absidia repens TaxID=90262 RepID=A0A1X2I3M3_9FUNG|nr:hypothetical protein BCR42DRAFT_424658 [Absidia repens]